MAEVAELSEIFNDEDLDDYVKPEIRFQCEQLRIIEPEEDSRDIVTPFLYLKSKLT